MLASGRSLDIAPGELEDVMVRASLARHPPMRLVPSC